LKRRFIWIATVLAQLIFRFEALLFLLMTKYDYYSLIRFAVPVGFSIFSLLYFACGTLLGMTAIHVLLHTTGLFIFSTILMARRLFKRDKPFVPPMPRSSLF
jgi:heme/copper-type cytochrome/quinol oxidase subunit 3